MIETVIGVARLGLLPLECNSPKSSAIKLSASISDPMLIIAATLIWRVSSNTKFKHYR